MVDFEDERVIPKNAEAMGKTGEVLTEVKRPFFWKKKMIGKEKIRKAEKIKEPVLFLMRNNRTVNVYENVKSGWYDASDKGDETQKKIYLDPSRLVSINYGDQTIKGWIAYTDYPVAYPASTKHLSDVMYRIISFVTMNNKDLEERSKIITAKGKMWLMIIFGIGITAAIVFSMLPQIKSFFGGG